MNRTPWLAATGAAIAIGLTLVGVAVAATPEPAATEKPETPEVEPVMTTLTGILRITTDADAHRTFAIGDTPISVGPPWYWGTNDPLTALADGDTVTVNGHMDDGTGGKADRTGVTGVPEFEVYAVNGKTIREAGKPAWAGGPKAVGSVHPGYAGWSKDKATTAP